MLTDTRDYRYVLVGGGNVAMTLAPALHNAGLLTAWANRTPERIAGMACKLGTETLTLDQVAGFRPDTLIMSVADGAIADVADAIGHLPGKPLCLLTSGTVGMEALLPLGTERGVLYPLQTFTAGTTVDLHKVPFFTEASSQTARKRLDTIVRLMNLKAFEADARQRRILHIAGVFTNNFVNILLEKAQELLASEGLPLETVEPLARMTIDKAFAIGPHAAQTGPARRGDTDVMKSQFNQLPPHLRPIFLELNRLICRSHNTNCINE